MSWGCSPLSHQIAAAHRWRITRDWRHTASRWRKRMKLIVAITNKIDVKLCFYLILLSFCELNIKIFHYSVVFHHKGQRSTERTCSSEASGDSLRFFVQTHFWFRSFKVLQSVIHRNLASDKSQCVCVVFLSHHREMQSWSWKQGKALVSMATAMP